jgi:hypothetical protein
MSAADGRAARTRDGWGPRRWVVLDDGVRRLIGGVSVNLAESERRKLLGVGALDEPELISFLWSFPTGGFVCRDDLNEAQQRLVDRLTPFHIAGTERLQRKAMPPLRLDVLVSIADDAPTALRSFGRHWWAPIQVVVSDRPASPTTRSSARRWGMGLIEGGRCTVEAKCSRSRSHRPLQWWLAEEAFARLLNASGRPAATARGPATPGAGEGL